MVGYRLKPTKKKRTDQLLVHNLLPFLFSKSYYILFYLTSLHSIIAYETSFNMEFYMNHILTREITTNARNCLVMIFHIETLPEAILIFIKEKKEKISKGLFPIIPILILQHTSYRKAYVYLGELFCLQVKGTDAIE